MNDDGRNNTTTSEFLYSRDKNKYDGNSRIMVSAIISLSFVVILVTLLHLYARCVIRRQARRQETLRRLGFLRAAAVIHTAEPSRTGLDPSVIAALPVFVLKQPHGNSTECSVCLCALEDGEKIRTLPNCKHSFHVDCIDKWFGSNSTCPICRMEAEPRLVPEPREGVAAPPLEGTTDGGGGAKVNGGSGSRLSSFRRILSRERSSRRIQNHPFNEQDDGFSDLERQ